MRQEYVGLGQFVSAGSPLAATFSTDSAQVRLPLTDRQLAALGLPIDFTASDDSSPQVKLSATVAGVQRHWSAQLTRIDPAFDPLTRVIYAVAEVKSPYGEQTLFESGAPLAVGLYVNAEISGQTLNDAITIPRQALRAGGRVFVVNDGALEIRTVTVNYTNHESAVITEGLDLGEQVVISPVRDPVNGLRVVPMDEAMVKGETQTAQEPTTPLEDQS